MIAYTTVGTNDRPRAAAFYDQLFTPFGYKRLPETDTHISLGIDVDATLFILTKLFDGKPASARNGAMVALTMKNPSKINATHADTLKLDATD